MITTELREKAPFGDSHHIKTLFRNRQLRRSPEAFSNGGRAYGGAKLGTDAVQGFLARLNNFLARLDNSVAGFPDHLLSSTIRTRQAHDVWP